jgi:hypothetical protein
MPAPLERCQNYLGFAPGLLNDFLQRLSGHIGPPALLRVRRPRVHCNVDTPPVRPLASWVF